MAINNKLKPLILFLPLANAALTYSNAILAKPIPNLPQLTLTYSNLANPTYASPNLANPTSKLPMLALT